MLHRHFRMMARFNGWANRRLYDAAAKLPEAEYRKKRAAAYFGSIHGTLNHILVGDRVWLARIENRPHGIARLDQILCDDLPSLRAAREQQDRAIVELADGFDEEALAKTRSYTMMSAPGETTSPLAEMLATVFNHQTHHRGQVHALLKEAGAEPPALDIVVYLRDPAEPKVD
ncbi:MAG: DinB family protein [Kiloniellales bacterium]